MPVVTITEDYGDSIPDTVILRTGAEIHKPLLEASTGSTVIPVTGEEQVPMGNKEIRQPPPEVSPPSLSSRLFSRKPLAAGDAVVDGGLMPEGMADPSVYDPSLDEDED